jgi:hypothetical protein
LLKAPHPTIILAIHITGADMAAMDGAAGVIRSQDDNQGQLEILKKR